MDRSKFYYSDGVPFHGIFREIPMSGQWIKEEPKEPVYTIDTKDTDLPSAHQIYMNSMNEYDAAVKLTPSWEYWQGMLKSVTIKRMIENWREEKMLKDQAAAREMLWEQAKKGNVSAMKVLYESKKEEAEQKRRMSRAQQEDLRHQQLAEATISRLKVVK